MSWLQRAASWIGGHEKRVLIGALLVVAAIWAFAALAGEVREGDTRAFDEWVLKALRDPADPSRPIGPWWLEEAARDVTALGSVTVLALVIASVLGFLLIQRRTAAMWLILASTLGGALLTSELKELFGRERPSVVPHLTRVLSASFPSGHAMLSAVVYLTLGVLLARVEPRFRVRAYLISVALGVTFLVGLSRIYLGVHYPTDVLAGWTAGLAWALLCWLVARALQRRGAVEGNPP